MRYFLDPSIGFGLIVLAVPLFLLGFRRQSGAVLIGAFLIFTYPTFRDYLLSLFPYWVSIIIIVIILLTVLRFVLRLLVGDAVDQVVGILLADVIRGLVRFPFWIGRKLHLGTKMMIAGSALGRGSLRAGRASGNYAKERLAEARSRARRKKAMKGFVDDVEAQVIDDDGQHYILDLGNGSKGILPTSSSEESLALGQKVLCRVCDVTEDESCYSVKLVGQPAELEFEDQSGASAKCDG